MIRFLIVFILLVATAWPQNTDSTSSGSSQLPPRVLEDNGSYQVQRLDLSSASHLRLAQSSDAVIVTLGDGIVLANSKESRVDRLSDGDVRFFNRGTSAELTASSSGSSQILAIELKHHWDQEISLCEEPKACTHTIRAGGMEIGTSTSLFTNGFITAYRDRIDRGGTLSTSYYSTKGAHHLMFVALEDLHADFDGTQQDLKRGQVFGSDAEDVEVDAGAHEARWVVIREEVPKSETPKKN